MRKIIIALAATTIAVSAGYTFAQTSDDASNDPVVETRADHRGGRFKKEPVDLQTFSRMEDLTSADKNGDGMLSRDEIEAHALAQLVKRAADRIERRLDVNRDGKVELSEIEKQKEKRFALLDTNEDGKLDRQEMRAGKHAGKHGERHHGKRFHRMQH
jgi:Ca2+-binding EF-hand superfamily protein